MEPLQNLAASTAATHRWQPRRYRHRINSLAYVKLDSTNGGVIRNLSEYGISIEAVEPLRMGQEVNLRFDLTNPRQRVEAKGRVAWENPQGYAGLEYLNLSIPLRRRLKEWIFTQLLATAELAGRGSIFAEPGISAEGQALTFSENPRRPIVLAIEPPTAALAGVSQTDSPDPREISSAQGVGTPWWLVDALILVCAVLLFLVIALGMTNSVPAWPVAVMLMLGVATAFAGLYWFLFPFWMGITPGEHLARLTTDDGADFSSDGSDQDRPRFR